MITVYSLYLHLDYATKGERIKHEKDKIKAEYTGGI